MLTGEIPRGRFDLPSVQNPGVDPRFDPIVDRAMQRNPAKRYSSALEIRSDLEKIVPAPSSAGSGITATPVEAPGVTQPLSESERHATPVAPITPPPVVSAPAPAPAVLSHVEVPPVSEAKPTPEPVPVEVVSAPPRFSPQYAREKITPDLPRSRRKAASPKSRAPAYLIAAGVIIAIGLAVLFLPRLPWERWSAALSSLSEKAKPTPVAPLPTPAPLTGAATPAAQGAPGSGFSIGRFPNGGLDPGMSDRRGGNPTSNRPTSPDSK